MHITIWLRATLLSTVFLVTAAASAQTSTCKDSLVHRQLLFEMWNAASQEEPKKVYDACKAMQAHARAEGDRFAVYTAWVCADAVRLRADRRSVASLLILVCY